MSVTGKATKSIQKKEVSQSRLVNLGYSNVRALHQATLNQTVIQMASLSTPSGLTNYSAPSVSLLTSTNLLLFQNNMKLTSSISGPLMMNISYVISGASTIKLLYSARENEIFEIVIDQNPRTSTNLADAAPLVSTGTLTANTTDYNVGTPYAVGKYLTYQHGAVMVWLDNQLVYRNTGNNPPGAGVTGDYYEVLAGSGLGTIIRFNTADPINDRNVSVVSVGSLVERPSASQLAILEALQGQIDAIVPYVASLSEVAETVFQATPNNTDLKAFGDRVLTAEGNITSQGTRITNLELGPSITKITASGTYTVPAGAKWLKIKMVGGGGGGGGSGTAPGAGNTGGTVTFDVILSATGGSGGGFGGGSGGTTTINSPATGAGFQGGDGQGAGQANGSAAIPSGGQGASTPFAGGGSGAIGSGASGTAGTAAKANTGAGGGGAGSNNAGTGQAGGGGGAGGYLEAAITGPLAASYSITIPAAATGGTAGGSGAAGGNGATGGVVVEAYF